MKWIDRLELSQAQKTAWIFGAGASRSDPYAVPVQSELLQHFATMTRPGTKGLQAKLQELRERVRGHCQRIQPGLAFDSTNLSLEEVFSAYELVLANPASSQERLNAEGAVRDLGDALRQATLVFGPGNAAKFKPYARDGTPSPYAELVEKLFPKTDPQASLKKHPLITFNYDINLDRCLINRRAVVDVDLDYGIPLANERSPGAPQFDPPRPDRSTLLLRLHGGLNWIRCQACQSCFVTVNKQAAVKEDDKCWTCGGQRLAYILVYPSFLRTYSDPLIQLVWGRCHEELVRADRWVFIGYSLPTADVHFRQLLRDCLRIRKEENLQTSVVLVGKEPELSSKDVVSYQHLFEGSPAELLVWKATTRGFSDFVDKALV